MGIKSFARSVKLAVDRRIKSEARALRGRIEGNRFIAGSRSYPFHQAVDCNTSDGNRVWAQLANNDSAVIVGE